MRLLTELQFCPTSSRKKHLRSQVLFSIQSEGLVYHHDAVVYIIAVGVYHYVYECIFLRIDDILNFVLMICNSFGIDDIHAFGVI